MNRFINTKNSIALCLTVISLALFTQCAEEFESPDIVTGNTLVDVAAADSTLEILSAALTKTGIGISLDNINSGQHTVFAPSDSAFRRYFQPVIGGGPGDAAIIAYINTLSGSTNPTLAVFTARLQYHIVSSEVMADEITDSQVFTTINTARLSLSDGTNVWINGNAGANGAKVRRLDLDGANGVIHVINNFMTAISTASVVTNTLGITVNYATSPPTVTVGATAGSAYDLLANAIKKTGLATTLRPNVPTASLPDFTIFAPDDAAMITYLGVLSGGTVTDEATGITYINGLAEGTALTTLTKVVKYHIATGRILTTDLAVGEEVSSLLTGETFSVDAMTPSIILKDDLSGTATITGTNTLTNAGVLHRLNSVLKPE